jgi:hypothetical protein
MGAFDTYSDLADCPRCGAIHFVEGQTKFFDPDFGSILYRCFERGLIHPLDAVVDRILASALESDWWRVSAHPIDDSFTLLADLDDLYRCSCGAPLATLLRFRLHRERPTPGVTVSTSKRSVMCAADQLQSAVELLDVELLDVEAADPASRVDFASVYGAVGYRSEDWQGDHDRLVSLSPEKRVGKLRDALAALFSAPIDEAGGPWTSLRCAVRCEACGEERERRVGTLLSHPDYRESFFGPGWGGGVIVPGTAIRTTRSTWERDLDRGFLVRVSPPPRDARAVVVIHRPERWGCRCKAERVCVRARFDLVGHTLAFSAATLRVVRSARDLEDTDFVEAPNLTRDLPGFVRTPRPDDLAGLRGAVLREWGVVPP